MQDVAAKAKVSVMTVSNVINGRSARVSEETRLRVNDVIQELGYRLNMSARHLRHGRTGLVGLGVPEFGIPYYAELAARLGRRFAARGFRLVVEQTSGTIAGELESLADARLDLYDGYILAVAAGDSMDIDRVATSRPVVLVGERALSARFDHVVMDNVGGSALAIRTLLAAGARRIALLGGDLSLGDNMQGMRTRGYVAGLEAGGVGLDPDLVVDSEPGTLEAYSALAAAMAGGLVFDAVLAVTDAGAVGALRALAERGWAVPGDVQVVGFDNLAIDEFLVPSLTSVEPDNEAMADAVCSLVVARLGLTTEDPGGPGIHRRVVMPAARIVLRESTRTPADS